MSKGHHPKMNDSEEKAILALRNLLKEDLISEETTLQDMLKHVKSDSEETSHLSQFRWEGIDDAFQLKVSDSPHKDAITSAFFQTHTYKYVDNPTFELSFERELRQRAVPQKEVKLAVDSMHELVNELKKNPGEQDSGWSQIIDDLVDVTTNADNRTAKHADPFTGGGARPEGDTYDKGNLEGFGR